MAENTSTPTVKPTKKKGIIRWEAVIPFLIVSVLTFIYFHFFFDFHLRKAFEFAGYQVLGAEVDIADVDTSFFKGTFRMQGVQITDATEPTHNLIEIGDIRFGFLWDGILRAKVVVEEMAVEKIKIKTQRKTPGRVKPPDPKKAADGPSAVEQLKDKALDTVQDKYEGNVLGDVAALLSGNSAQDQLKNIEGSLPSKAKVEAFSAAFKEKQKSWEERIKNLPKGPEIKALGDRLSKVKTKDFKTPMELQASLKEIDTIVKDADSKIKNVSETGSSLNSEIKQMETDLKDLDAQIKADIKSLESRFRLPSLDASSLTRAVFMQYMGPYIAKLNYYKGIFEKYAPPNIVKKVHGEKDEEADEQIQPRPRGKGVSYEFGRPNSYPLFWIKNISVSSQIAADPQAGNISGKITDVTSNQLLTRKPTVADLKGDFPAQQVSGFHTRISLDNTKPRNIIGFELGVGSYGIAGRELVTTPDVTLAFAKAAGSLDMQGTLTGFKDIEMSLDNKFQKVEYAIQAKQPVVQQILTDILNGIPTVTIEAKGTGSLPVPHMSLNSNLGPELAKGFQAQLQKKIEELQARLKTQIDEAVGKERAKLDAEFQKVKGQVDGEVKKVQAQLDEEKKKAEDKVKVAQKDGENKAKDEVKKAGGKALEDLKKKFKW